MPVTALYDKVPFYKKYCIDPILALVNEVELSRRKCRPTACKLADRRIKLEKLKLKMLLFLNDPAGVMQ